MVPGQVCSAEETRHLLRTLDLWIWTFSEGIEYLPDSVLFYTMYHQQPPQQGMPYVVQPQPQQPQPGVPYVIQPQAIPMNNMNMINNTVMVGAGGGTGNTLVLVSKDKLQTRDWNSGICSCLNDITSCMCGISCLPLLLCRISNRLDECAFVTWVIPGGFTALRTKLRTMGGIKGSICSDCLMTTCCTPCAACQMSRELDSMGL
ncbi:uncharacterized protein LOC131951810 [Physella acuta]|uniref:uncharacterized protein LOC131951810 n=1 Tax=Physella acuta TaxID=109671 RepID=UPI0027DAF757|nr:uncharacterized protein LOC131951810 [Physella acuta]